MKAKTIILSSVVALLVFTLITVSVTLNNTYKAEKAVADKIAADKVAAEKAAVEKVATEKVAAANATDNYSDEALASAIALEDANYRSKYNEELANRMSEILKSDVDAAKYYCRSCMTYLKETGNDLNSFEMGASVTDNILFIIFKQIQRTDSGFNSFAIENVTPGYHNGYKIKAVYIRNLGN